MERCRGRPWRSIRRKAPTATARAATSTTLATVKLLRCGAAESIVSIGRARSGAVSALCSRSTNNVVKGSRLRSTDRTPGTIPYVGASRFNNGITHYIGNDEHVHPGGVLTVCYNGPVGTTFYQPDDFWATDDVNVLYPVSTVSPEALLFIAPVIEQVGSNYAYVDKWKLADMKAAKIKLPVDATGAPDWAYMESVMKALLKQKASDLDVLEQLLPQSEVQEAI